MNQTKPLFTLSRAAEAVPLNVFGTRVTVLSGGNETGGASSMARIVCQPGTGAPPHRHAEAENFVVTRGALSVMTEGENFTLSAGDAIHIRPGAVHAFQNTSESEVEFLAIGTPAGHEKFFLDADELARTGRFNPETAAEVCARHGIELVR